MKSFTRLKSLPIFLIACILTLGFGGLFLPGPWYESLHKAPWNPPNVVFPIVWSALYLLIAVAGWLIFTHSDLRLKQLWVLQLLLNGAWSWIFFGQHWVLVAMVDIALLNVVVATLIWRCFRSCLPAAGWLLLPYLLWIALASSLNAYILIAN
ncbi:MAG: tryptophan-rich sensory protein [Gammaproteobacteria bacterium]|nr:tryptophan-rich sensory protein [Gammaproteobacteria bacterium]